MRNVLFGVAALVISAYATATLRVAAQTTTTFEVASIHPHASDDDQRVMMPLQPGGRFTATNVTTRQLLQRAYAGQTLEGGAGWIDSDGYDVAAKGPGETTPAGLSIMLQALLRDRFKLVVHKESRQGVIYALTLAHPDGALGRQMKLSATDCAPGGPVQPTRGADLSRTCGMTGGPFRLIGTGVRIPQLVVLLSRLMQRPVVDRTNLSASYDFELAWTPDQLTPGAPPDSAPADTIAPSILTALREQLGLKLNAERGPVDVLVIDHVESPTSN